MESKVLVAGCAKCKTTAAQITSIASQLGVDVTVTKVEDMAVIVSHGIMSTPGVLIDGKLVHVGSVPDRAQIEAWLGAA